MGDADARRYAPESEGFASNLSSGSKQYTLEQFCAETGRSYHHTQIPVAVENFVAYGEEFARRFVPNLEVETSRQSISLTTFSE